MTRTKILVAHDFSDAANRALRFAAELAAASASKLVVCYVHPDIYDGSAELSLTLPAALPGQGERYLRFLEEELRAVAKSVLGEVAGEVETHVLRGEPVKQLENFARETGAEMICVGATGKGGVQRVLLGSVSQQLLRTAPSSVLIVP